MPPAPPSGGRVDFTSRYRPKTIEELVGEKLRREVTNLLRFGIGKVLLSGPYGYGYGQKGRRRQAQAAAAVRPPRDLRRSPGHGGRVVQAVAGGTRPRHADINQELSRRGQALHREKLDLLRRGRDRGMAGMSVKKSVKIRAKTGNSPQRPAMNSPSGNGAPRENRTPISALKGRRPSR